MPTETIRLRRGRVELIDQTLLPHEFRYISCSDIKALWRAIKTLQVRGAPAIGIAGALGIVLGTQGSGAKTAREFLREVNKAARYLALSRPTAVNLFWALARMERVAMENASKGVGGMKRALMKEAISVIKEDKEICRRMARHGAALVRTGDCILTHCNAGGLATADYGTALGVLFESKAQGKRIKVYVDETRPLLQGARLTTWELMRAGIDTTLICDNMAASLMEKGAIDKIFVGADRISASGDFANKIGTYGLAVLSKYHKVPFYVVAPVSTFDMKIKNGSRIPIEERDQDEVRKIFGKQLAPKKVKAYNPAFDVTPHGLVTAFVTETGIFRPPFDFRRLKCG